MKTKFHTLFLTIVLACNTANAQAPSYEWAISSTGQGDDRGNKITVDQDGNTIITGRFTGREISFEHIKLVNTDQDSSTSDVFVAKYNSKGKILWAKSFEGNDEELGLHLVTTKKGAIILLGAFDSETLKIGKETFTNKTEKGKGSDIFMVKLSSDGAIIWAKSFGGEKHDSGYATCAIDQEENIYVTGNFYSNSFPIGSKVLTKSMETGSDVFVAKFSSAGELIWAKNSRGTKESETQSCSVDPKGNLVISGWFSDQNFTLDDVTLKNAREGSMELFVASFAPEGQLNWAKSFGGPSFELGTCAVDKQGNIVLAGMYGDSVLTFGTTQLINKGDGNLFVAKLTNQGEVIWAKTAGGSAGDGVRSCCIDKTDNIIITGSFSSSEWTFGNTSLTKKEGNEALFIAAYSPDGKELWAKSAGGKGRNVGRGCSSNKKGNIYLTGSFDAETLMLDSLSLKNSGDSDVFILKLSGNH